MSDNVALTPGAGTLISTDEITTLNGGAVTAQQIQRVSLAMRTADGIAVDLSSGTATLANVSGSATSVQLVAANTNRVALVIVNDSTAILYVKYGTTASSTDYTYKLFQSDTLREELFTGRVDGIWASATGAARVTELSA